MQSMLPSRYGQSVFKYWQILDVPQKLYFFALVSISAHTAFLLIPGGVFELFGIRASELVTDSMPNYIQFAAHNSTTLFLYWISYPYVAGVNTLVLLVAINSRRGFQFFSETYLYGRGILATLTRKLKFWLLAIGFWTAVIWVVWIWPQTPNRHGFHPVSNPIMLCIIYGGLLSMLLPLCVVVLLTDIRSWFLDSTNTEK
jgi:hypothetical protein